MPTVKEKEHADRRLLSIEIFVGVTLSVFFMLMVFIASFIQMEAWLRVLLIAISFVVFFIGGTIALKIEQVAGYYECAKCHHRYVPTFKSILFAMHINRTRYMKCPECKQRSWNKKVIAKE